MTQACNASSAALTYFPLHTLSLDNSIYTDGSVTLNNPTPLAFATAIEAWPEAEIRILSVGTAELSPKVSTQANGVVSALPEALEFVTEAQSADIMSEQLVTALSKMGKKCKYVRVSGKVPDALQAMDDAGNVQKLVESGYNTWMTDEVKAQLTDFFAE